MLSQASQICGTVFCSMPSGRLHHLCRRSPSASGFVSSRAAPHHMDNTAYTLCKTEMDVLQGSACQGLVSTGRIHRGARCHSQCCECLRSNLDPVLAWSGIHTTGWEAPRRRARSQVRRRCASGSCSWRSVRLRSLSAHSRGQSCEGSSSTQTPKLIQTLRSSLLHIGTLRYLLHADVYTIASGSAKTCVVSVHATWRSGCHTDTLEKSL